MKKRKLKKKNVFILSAAAVLAVAGAVILMNGKPSSIKPQESEQAENIGVDPDEVFDEPSDKKDDTGHSQPADEAPSAAEETPAAEQSSESEPVQPADIPEQEIPDESYPAEEDTSSSDGENVQEEIQDENDSREPDEGELDL